MRGFVCVLCMPCHAGLSYLVPPSSTLPSDCDSPFSRSSRLGNQFASFSNKATVGALQVCVVLGLGGFCCANLLPWALSAWRIPSLRCVNSGMQLYSCHSKHLFAMSLVGQPVVKQNSPLTEKQTSDCLPLSCTAKIGCKVANITITILLAIYLK